MPQKTYPLRALAIDYPSTASIKRNPNNTRKHPPSQVKKLAQTMREVGFLVPIVVDADGVILAGHARLEAAIVIGLKTVPAVYVRDLSEAQARAFMIADNKLGDLSSFDMEKLAIEFDFLLKGDDSFSIENTGFDIVELIAFWATIARLPMRKTSSSRLKTRCRSAGWGTCGSSASTASCAAAASTAPMLPGCLMASAPALF